MAEKKKKAAQKKKMKAPEMSTQPKRLRKSVSDRVICGVAGGIAEYIDIDPIIVRILFVLMSMGGGSGVLIYIVLCLIMPEPGSEKKNTKEVMKENSKDLEKTVKDFAETAETAAKSSNSQLWIGVLVIIIGISLFFNNLGIWNISAAIGMLSKNLWPLIIIGLGIYFIIRNDNEKKE